MKKLKPSLALIGFVALLMSCGEKDPQPACVAQSISINDQGSVSTFNFSADLPGKISTVSFYIDTDSAYNLTYTYDAGKVTKVERRNGVNEAIEKYFTVEYDGEKIAKYVEYTFRPLTNEFTVSAEARYQYSNGSLASVDIFAPSANGNFFQIADISVRFLENNVERVQYNIDIASTIALIFGAEPTSYSGVKIFVREASFDHAPNPLAGNFIPEPGFLTLGLNANNEKSIFLIANNGATHEVSFLLEYNEQNFVTSGLSDLINYEVLYDCK